MRAGRVTWAILGHTMVSRSVKGDGRGGAVEATTLQKATFAAGGFWHVEDAFRRVKGVVYARVGYTGGFVENPGYKLVCTDTTGHAEAIEVTFDPDVLPFED